MGSGRPAGAVNSRDNFGTGGVFDERKNQSLRVRFLRALPTNGVTKDHYGDFIDKVESFRKVHAENIRGSKEACKKQIIFKEGSSTTE